MRHTLDVDEDTVRRIEAVYRTPELVAQRQAVIRRLDPQPGEHLLDIGCGPGFLAADLAGRLGSDGQVRGVDFSEPMLTMARHTCDGLPQATFEGAFATDLPYVNERFDAAVSAQVYEYLRDTEAALAELYRVLRPGGRALILDTDWQSLVWYADDQPRMDRILLAWQDHQPHPDLPRRLSPLLRQAGFEISVREIFPLFNTEYNTGSYSYSLIEAIRSFVPGRNGLNPSEVDDWAAEQQKLGQQGRFFFSLNRYLFLVTKPDNNNT